MEKHVGISVLRSSHGEQGEAEFSLGEQLAFEIGIVDARRSGCASDAGPLVSWHRRLSAAIFGRSQVNPLADPRLEALRLFACAAYRNRRPRSELAASLREVGFKPAQIDVLVNMRR